MRDPVKAILDFNRRFRGRYPQALRRKVELLCGDPFHFFRGTFHLFCSDWLEGRFDPWPDDSPIRDHEIRMVADVHGENFGAYGGDHHHSGLYGVNDFDEETTGRLDFDACRAATSILLAGSGYGLLPRSAFAGAHAFVESYVDVLSGAKFPRDPKPVRDLLRDAQHAHRHLFIQEWTEIRKGARRFHSKKFFPLLPRHREQALRLLADYRTRPNGSGERDPGFYEVEDVAYRIAGCGSLGRFRYVILLRGKSSEDAHNTILEFKESLPSGLDEARRRSVDRRSRSRRAEEVASETRVFQGEPDSFLGFARDGDLSFQVRQLSPRERRLEGKQLASGNEFRETAATYGAHLALAHRRANRGAAARLLREVSRGAPESFVRRTMAFAMAYHEQVQEDWLALKSRRAQALSALAV